MNVFVKLMSWPLNVISLYAFHLLCVVYAIYCLTLLVDWVQILIVIVIGLLSILLGFMNNYQNNTFRTLFSIVLLQMDVGMLTIINQRNFQSSTYAQFIIAGIISKSIFEEQRVSIRLKYKEIIYFMIIFVPLVFQIAYTILLIGFKQDTSQILVCLIISVLNNQRQFFINRNSSHQRILQTVTENMVLSNNKMDGLNLRRVLSNQNLDFQQGSVQDANSIHIDNFSHIQNSYINVETIYQSLEYFSDGLIILERDPLNDFPFNIKLMNKAMRFLFGITSNYEMINLLQSLPSLQFSTVEQDGFGNESMINQQKVFNQHMKLCRSMLFKGEMNYSNKYNPMEDSTQNQNGQLTMKMLLDKLYKSSRNDCITVHTVFHSSQLVNNSNNFNEFMIEFTITKSVDKQIILIAQDVTHKQKIKYLKEYDIQKSKMLSFVSHEYRTPLNCIIEMLTNISEQQILQSENLFNLQIAIDNSQYILNLSNDLLDLAQIKNNKFTIKKTWFNLEQLAKESLSLFHTKAKMRDLKLVVNYDNQLSKGIHSDKNRLKQILINLLGNAFKFTTKGSIRIQINKVSKNIISIGVKDDGIGIQEEDQKLLFKAFSKVNSEDSKKLNEQGVGLGLVISNQIAQQISCDNCGLQLESIYGQGSYFYFLLECQEKKASNYKIQEIQLGSNDIILEDNQIAQGNNFQLESIVQQELKATVDSQNCQHILIVDDEIFNIHTLKLKLNKMKIQDFDQANHGKEAIEKVKQKKCCSDCQGYKIIFMDLELPIMNGLIVTSQILKLKPNQIIIGCSGYTEQSEKDKCLSVGMKDYLTKPIDNMELEKVLNSYYY